MRKERRAYWSKALGVVLEKHGYLEIQDAGSEALSDPRTFSERDAVLVARLPADSFDSDFAACVEQGRAGVLLEGPLSRPVEEALGVRTSAPVPRVGEVTVVDARLSACAGHLGVPLAGRLTEPRSRPISRDPAFDWRALKATPLTEPQADAWGASGWDAARWTVDDRTETLATWRTQGAASPSPGIVRRGKLVGCSFGLFAFLAQRHSSEPFQGAEHRATDRTVGIESILLALLDLFHRDAGRVRHRVMPWPKGKRWALSVRHDFDRPLWSPRVAATLRRHARVGTAATWYWRSQRTPGRAISLVAADPRHEVALHTERVWAHGGDEERVRVEAAAGGAVRGSSAHGTWESFRFQGAPNVLWAHEQGLLYTELIEQAHFHPHRFPALAADGSMSVLDIICLPHHESFELSYRNWSGSEADRIAAAWGEWRARRGFMQIMNHPDRNARKMFRILRSIPAEERLDCTAEQAAEWWRRSHVATELTLRSRSDGSVELLSRSGVRDLVLESLNPDGTRCERTFNLEPGRIVRSS